MAAEVERPGDNILIMRLSPYHSLDLVRIPKTQKYRVVFAERLGIQRRAFVEISYEQARQIAAFLTDHVDVEAPTHPGSRQEAVPAEAVPTAVLEDPSPSRTPTRDPKEDE
jgi:hypothetical protein